MSYLTPYIPLKDLTKEEENQKTKEEDPLKGLTDLSRQITKKGTSLYYAVSTDNFLIQAITKDQASPSLEESERKFQNFFTTKNFISEHFQTSYCLPFGLLFSQTWYTRVFLSTKIRICSSL